MSAWIVVTRTKMRTRMKRSSGVSLRVSLSTKMKKMAIKNVHTSASGGTSTTEKWMRSWMKMIWHCFPRIRDQRAHRINVRGQHQTRNVLMILLIFLMTKKKMSVAKVMVFQVHNQRTTTTMDSMTLLRTMKRMLRWAV